MEKNPISCSSKKSKYYKNKPGLTNYSANIKTEKETFNPFVTDELININVMKTNIKAEQVLKIKII